MGTFSDLAFTDFLPELRKALKLPDGKSVIWYPRISRPVIMEAEKSTADKFDNFLSWLKKFNPAQNYFTNGQFLDDLQKFFKKN